MSGSDGDDNERHLFERSIGYSCTSHRVVGRSIQGAILVGLKIVSSGIDYLSGIDLVGCIAGTCGTRSDNKVVVDNVMIRIFTGI